MKENSHGMRIGAKADIGHRSEMGGGAAGQGSKETLRQALAVLQHVEEFL
jgi:hypothetical protein